jgi:hypothetical protein
MTSREEHQEEDLEEEIAETSLCLQPRIFEGKWQEVMPSGFDAVTIQLDGRVQADLDWKKERAEAQRAVEQGYALMWNIDLGLFGQLVQPLTSQSQFLSLTLALEYFRDSLWKEFKSHTIGLTLFRGSADFSRDFCWDESQEQNLKHWLQEISASHLAHFDSSQLMQQEEGKQFVRLYCRDVVIEYLALLATRLPDSLSVYLFLDLLLLPRSSLIELQVLNPERFDRLHLALKGHQLPFDVLGWGNPTSRGYSGHSWTDLPAVQEASIGICVPPMHVYHASCYQGLEKAILALQKKSLSFRMIAERDLTAQWDGLDDLFYSSLGLSPQGKRKLQGFCAAGGTVVATGPLLHLPHELSLEEWLQKDHHG